MTFQNKSMLELVNEVNCNRWDTVNPFVEVFKDHLEIDLMKITQTKKCIALLDLIDLNM